VFFFSDHHILATVLLTPLVGAIVLLFIPRERVDLQRKIGGACGVLGLLVGLPLLWKFKANSAEPFQFVTDANWIQSLGVHFTLAIDGLGLLMVMMTALLGAVAIVSSWSAIRRHEKEYYILLLLLQTGLLGVFMSLDFVLFYCFWVAVLVPVYLLIAVWGSGNRLNAAMKFVLYALAGSVVQLLAILGVAHARGTFDMREILLHPFNAQSGNLQNWLFWGFIFAFAIRVPMFPLHTWLPDALTEAPTAASVILAGALLNTGVYGLLRFAVPMFPGGAWKYHALLIVLSLIAIVYGALICLTQKDMKRLIAYASISQMGLCTLGISVLTPVALYGTIVLQFSFGITTAALLLIVGILYERRQTHLISEFGGLARPMPKFTVVYAIVTFAALGMPLLSGFIGEFAILRGAFAVGWSLAAWALLGMVLIAASLLWLQQRVVFGKMTNPANEGIPDLDRRELGMLIPLAFLSFWIGVYPAPLFRALKQPVERIVSAVHPGYFPEPQNVQAVPAPANQVSTSTPGPSIPEAK
jgi:NADH-quinone oxidoreductase subunit M